MSVDNTLRSERQQTILRIIMALGVGSWVLVMYQPDNIIPIPVWETFDTPHYVVFGYFIYALVWALLSHTSKNPSLSRNIAALIIDLGSVALVAGFGSQMVAVLVMPAWIITGYGVRYGVEWVYVGEIIALITQGMLLFTPWWQAHAAALLPYVALNTAMPFYFLFILYRDTNNKEHVKYLSQAQRLNKAILEVDDTRPPSEDGRTALIGDIVESQVIKDLIRVSNDPRYYFDLAYEFLNSISEQTDALRIAIQKHNWDEVRNVAHTVKGTSLTMGARRISEVATQINKADNIILQNEGEILFSNYQAALSEYRELVTSSVSVRELLDK